MYKIKRKKKKKKKHNIGYTDKVLINGIVRILNGLKIDFYRILAGTCIYGKYTEAFYIAMNGIVQESRFYLSDRTTWSRMEIHVIELDGQCSLTLGKTRC